MRPTQRRAILAAALLLAAPAVAQTPFADLDVDPEAALEMTADRMVVDREGGDIVMTGDVTVAQGEMRLTGSRVEVLYGQGEPRRIERIVATGDVTLVSAQDAAEAQSAVYDVIARTVVMTGDVLVTQPSGIVASERMTVDIDTGEAVMEGRVRTVLDQE